MSVSIVPVLQSKRQNYVNKKNNARNQITRCERAYESLSNFKTTVSQAQEDFHAINTNKTSILSEVANVKKNSITAQNTILECRTHSRELVLKSSELYTLCYLVRFPQS